MQDVQHLRAIYKENASTFFSNAGAIQTFGVNDHETAEWLSETMGKQTVEYQTKSVFG
ncbi:TraM recognition domain-containing protein (plasmid) [Devosia sp. A8/3-2]|nr:TraM recognition domain-containing protein [Devosia sp. A8/3-2]